MAAQERFEIPSEMRAFAEKSVEQAKQAFDGFISAAHQAVTHWKDKPRPPVRARTRSPEKRWTLPSRTSPLVRICPATGAGEGCAGAT